MTPFEATRDTTFASPEAAAERITSFLRSVYAWMCAGLVVTAATATFVASSPAMIDVIAGNRVIFWAIIIAQFGLVIALSAKVQTLPRSMASALFVAYSALTGVTLSFVLMVFTGESITTTFLITSSRGNVRATRC